MKSDLVVFSAIRNGINNGYPFVEAYGSWLNYCDRIFILDGNSDDGTDIVLRQLSKISPKFVFEKAPWPTASEQGSSIAQFTNQCLDIVRPMADRLIYMQADEILEKRTREKLSQWHGGPVELTKYVLFWNSFHRVIRFQQDSTRSRSTEWHSIKFFLSSSKARSVGDGLSFDVSNEQVTCWDDEVLHYGWNFPINILQKHTSHVRLYSDYPIYRKRAKDAAAMLYQRAFSREALDALDPQYLNIARPFIGRHPDCVQHLVDKTYYDPYLGLSLLRNSVIW